MLEQVLPSITPDRHNAFPDLQSAKLEYGPPALIRPVYANIDDDPEIIDQPTPETRYKYWELHRLRFDNPRYRKYREGQNKPTNSKQANVWPKNVEEVFWEAIAQFKPIRGRKKRPYRHSDPTKHYGRNEIIAMHMQAKLGGDDFFVHLIHNPDTTAENKKPRKVVSSHLQVLKAKFRSTPKGIRDCFYSVLEALGEDEKDTKSSRRAAIRRQAASRLQLPPVPRINPMQPAAFHMYLGSEHGKIIHTFTQSKDRHYHQDDVEYDSWQLRRQYPTLATMWTQRRPSYNVILADTTIAWTRERPLIESSRTDSTLWGKAQPTTTLTIMNTFHVPVDATNVPRNCHAIVNYYEGCKLVEVVGRNEIVNEEENGQHVLEVKMGSEFWVSLFQKLWKKMQRATSEANRNIITLEDLERVDQECRSEINQLTAVIVIYGQCVKKEKTDEREGGRGIPQPRETTATNVAKNDLDTDPSSDPLLAVHWSFKTSGPGCPGQTNWRNMVVSGTDTILASGLDAMVGSRLHPTVADGVPHFAMLPGGPPYRTLASSNGPWILSAGTQEDETDAAAAVGMAYPWHPHDPFPGDNVENHYSAGSARLDVDQAQQVTSNIAMPITPAVSTDHAMPLDPQIMAGVAESLGQVQQSGQSVMSPRFGYEMQGLVFSAQQDRRQQPQHLSWTHADAPAIPQQAQTNQTSSESGADGGVMLPLHSAPYDAFVPSMRSNQQGFESSHTLQRMISADHVPLQAQSQNSSFEEVGTPSSTGSAVMHGGVPVLDDMHYSQQSVNDDYYNLGEQGPFLEADDTPRHSRTRYHGLTSVAADGWNKSGETDDDVAHEVHSQLARTMSAPTQGYNATNSHQSLHERRGQYHLPPVHTGYDAAPSQGQGSSQSHDYSPYYANSGTSQSSSGAEVVLTPSSYDEHHAIYPYQSVSGMQQAGERPPEYSNQTTHSYAGLEGLSQHYSQSQQYAEYYQSQPLPQSQSHSQLYGNIMPQESPREEDWVHVEDGSSTPRRDDESLSLVFDPSVPQLLPSALEI